MKNHFTEEQLIKALKEHEGGSSASDIVRELRIAEQTFYNWKRKYGDYERFRNQKAERKRSITYCLVKLI